MLIKSTSHTLFDPLRKLNQNLVWPRSDIQDNNAYSVSSEFLETRGHLFIVSNGSGVPPYGAKTCKLAQDTLIKKFYKNPYFSTVSAQLIEAFQVANEVVFDYTRSFEKPILGCSMIAAVIKGTDLTVINIGNTAAYLIRETQVKKLVPLGQPVLSERANYFTPLLGNNGDLLSVRKEDEITIPPYESYLDILNRVKIKQKDILILTSDFTSTPDLLGEKTILDQAKYVSDGTIAQRLARATSDWYNRGHDMQVTITAIWFS